MQKIKNMLPLLTTFLVALCVFAAGSVGAPIQSVEQQKIEEDRNIAENFEFTLPQIFLDSEKTDKTEQQSQETPTPPSQPSGTVEVGGSNEEALGKIIERFISPYEAKYSYNNVYMKNSSGLSVDIKTELNSKLSFKMEKGEAPEVLIVHTHSTESFMSEERGYYTSSDATRSTDNSENIIHIGDIVAETLKNAGISVIHDTTWHDHPAYTGSYDRAAVTIREYLNRYPSIKVVLDIHRDSISANETDRIRPVAEIDGKKAAQVMLVMGSQSGTVKNFPNWRENLRLAFKFQQTMEVMYPGLARPLVLASRLYNENMTAGSMLLEVGTDSNTLEQAEYAALLAAKALASLLNTIV